MTFKQKLKLINIICVIIAAISLVIPDIKTSSEKLNTFQLINRNGFMIGILFLLIFVILTVATSFFGAYYDEKKYIPLCTTICSLGGLILSIFIRYISKGNGEIAWLDLSKIYIGGYILIVSLTLSFVLNLVISFRSLILKKNDDEEYFEDEAVEEEITEISSSTESTEDNSYESTNTK